MKLPKVIFVKHCPNLAPERGVFLEQHLEERVPIKDVRWMVDYNHDNPFVEWLNAKYNLPYGPKLTSNFVKTCFMLKQMVDDNIESALLIDDDVCFHKDWVKYFESIPDDLEKVGFLNLGTSPFFNLRPKMGEVYQLPNNGGCECTWWTLDMARNFLLNVNPNEAIDIIFHGFMRASKKPILNMPLCHQTSDVVRVSTLDHETRESSNWMAYVQNYENLPKVSFNKLIEDFHEFEKRRQRVEDKFEEIYGKRVDIKNVKYILNDDPDHRLNILEYELLIEDEMNV
jgi:hypothetical protein